MKRIVLVTLAALAALTMGLKAQDVSFDNLYKDLPQPVAAAPAVPAPAAVEPVTQAAPAAERDWLVMVFINGVNDLGILGFANKSINDMEKVGSTDRMAVVVEYGILGQEGAARNLQFQRGSKTIFVGKDNDDQRITSLPFYSSNDADMGSAANLERFVKRAVRRFPARRTAVIVWNHGGGRLGIAWDDVSKNHMEVDQLGRSLARLKQFLGRKIDVFATDACLMQMAGVAYELKDSADVIVGSEEVIPGDSYPYAEILGPLAANPGMRAEQLGTLMVDAYAAYYAGEKVTLSALRSSALPGFTELLNAWVKAVNADPKARKAALSEATVNTTYNFQMRDSRDLYDYLNNVDDLLPKSLAVKNASADIKGYLEGSLIIKDSALISNAHGLAIYIPDLRYNSANYEKLAFARDSLWDDFLRAMMEERLKP
ncbi:MAG: hypothetical protein HY952_02550 [Elusimicrobia bacterium]|nr:hypothetical protein [Elusimicrobiota bacterium]